jgi:hypothetical protein
MRIICHKVLGIGLIRDETLSTQFMTRLARPNANGGNWVQLRGDLLAYTTRGIVCIWKPTFFGPFINRVVNSIKSRKPVHAKRATEATPVAEKRARRVGIDDDDVALNMDLLDQTDALAVVSSEHVVSHATVAASDTQPSVNEHAQRLETQLRSSVIVSIGNNAGEARSLQFGAWTVSLRVVSITLNLPTRMLSLDDVCAGKFEYELPVAESYEVNRFALCERALVCLMRRTCRSRTKRHLSRKCLTTNCEQSCR